MLDKAEDYLIRSAECVVLGNFTDEVTVLGVGVQIVLGIFAADRPGVWCFDGLYDPLFQTSAVHRHAG